MTAQLIDDPNLPFMHLIWSRTAMAEFLDRYVLPVVWPGHRIASVNRARVNWTPGEKCEVLYELEMTDPAAPTPLRALLSFAPDGHELAAVYERQYGSVSDDLDECPHRALFLPDHRCLVEFFPHDWRLSSLARAMSPDEMLPIMVAALGEGSRQDQWRCEVSELRYRPQSRCVLLYGMFAQDSDDRREAIGKVYGKATDATRAFANNCNLHAVASDQGLVIPRPLAFADSLNLVLMERMHGTTIKEMLNSGADREQVARNAAAALATLHSLPFDGRNVDSLETKLVRFRRRATRLHIVAPELASRVETMLERIERLGRGLQFAAPGLIHSDAKPANLVMNGSGVGIVDFDLVRVGDPALDVGAFLAHFRKQCLWTGRGEFGRLSAPFLDEYESRNPEKGLIRRARLLEALALLRMAVKQFLRSPKSYAKKGSSSRPVRLLEESAICLESL